MGSICFICGILLSFYFTTVRAAVHPYKGTPFYQSGDAWLFSGGREGLYASTPAAVAHWMTEGKGIANGKSYIRLDHLEFIRPAASASDHSVKDGETGVVQALVFDVRDRSRVGYAVDGGGRHLCCSQELVRKTGCFPGKVIIAPKDGDNQWPRVLDIPFVGNDTSVTSPPTEVAITSSGMYYLWFVVCDKTLSGVTVTGATVWKNPGGYLPGMMAPFLSFYGFMSLAYLLLGLLWFLQFVRFWRDVFQLQHCITAVIVLGMAEMATWYFDFVNFNTTGFRPYGITLWAVILSAVRKTVSRILILVVSMGFGVVRPTLGGLTGKVLLLGGAYFVAVLSLDVVENVGTIDDLNSSERIFLVLPVAVLDAVFILWIFTSLSKTVAQLQLKKTSYKLDLYRRFTNSLAVSVVISIAWIGYEMYVKSTDKFNERWESTWVTTAFWHVLTFILLTVICILWAPSQGSTRYAFEDQGDETHEEEIALTKTSTPKPNAGEDKKPVNTDVFSLEDDVEEGKIE